MQINDITIIGGVDKYGNPEPISELTIRQGEVYGIVGPTGSGKSQLISDIEQLAQHDTSTGRTVLINGKSPSVDLRSDPRKKMIAQLSQNMNFLADMVVEDFLQLHAKCRGKHHVDVQRILRMANQLTGEPILKTDNLTVLSGGQTRALMVADVAVISESPIVLIDEIENAGIKKHEALQMLSGEGKIIFVVTHDPALALATEKRVIMSRGGMVGIVSTSQKERLIAKTLNDMDKTIMLLREDLRSGKRIENLDIDAFKPALVSVSMYQ